MDVRRHGFFLWSVKNQGGFKVGGQAGISDGFFSVVRALLPTEETRSRSEVKQGFEKLLCIYGEVSMYLRRIHVDVFNFI